jgi:HAD superfamily hydrolase (TIGR01459 family)
MRRFEGLAEVADLYDGFIIDLWGVIHDGVAPYPGALDCLARLGGKPVLLLSNAPRRAWAARQGLRTLGVEDHFYTDILTSGEATWLALRDRADPWFARLGRRVYHLGPERDLSVLEGLSLSLVDHPSQADFLLNTGPDDQRESQGIASFVPELEACLHRRLPMICANPDLEIVRGGVRILCAGALAEYYEQRGGDVRSVGKPDPAIYEMAESVLGVPRCRVLAVGDSLRTDIAGAARAGIDCVWVLGGLHASMLGGGWEVVEATAADAGLDPLGAVQSLAW